MCRQALKYHGVINDEGNGRLTSFFKTERHLRTNLSVLPKYEGLENVLFEYTGVFMGLLNLCLTL